MQERFYAESMKVASGMLKRLDAAKPDWVSTDCPLAALRIEKGLGVKALHPAILLNRAYQESAP
jgi:Fe-S oxidoreductase